MDKIRFGKEIKGSGFPEEYMYRKVEDIKKWIPEKPVICVREWTWVDIMMKPQQKKTFQLMGLQPSFIFSQRLIFDSSKKASPISWIKSKPMIAGQPYHNVVDTLDARYLLLAPGRQATFSSDEALSLDAFIAEWPSGIRPPL